MVLHASGCVCTFACRFRLDADINQNSGRLSAFERENVATVQHTVAEERCHKNDGVIKTG